MKSRESSQYSAIEINSNESQIESLLVDIRQLLLQKWNEYAICPDWIPKTVVQKYLDYGDTQMAALISNKDLVATKVGRRVFISQKSLESLLERNIQQ